MSVLVWWLIPIGLTLIAIVWVMIRARPPRPVDAKLSVAEADRMRQALSKPLPSNDGTTD